MPVRPVDYIPLVHQTQELSKVKQSEIERTKVQMENNFVQKEKTIKRNETRVNDPEKNERVRIDPNSKRQNTNGNKKRKEEEEKENKIVKNRKNEEVKEGSKIDIRI